MTEEEINNPKIGDKIRLELTVAEMDGKYVYLRCADGSFFTRARKTATSKIMRNGEKVEPLRVFGAGDVVKIIPDSLTCTVYGEGRKLSFYPECLVTVASSANEVGDVIIQNPSGARQVVNTHCLKLVKKAVKDKYYVHDLESMGDVIIAVSTMDGKTVAKYIPTIHPNAKAAAQAECDRLNAEWHKQQLN